MIDKPVKKTLKPKKAIVKKEETPTVEESEKQPEPEAIEIAKTPQESTPQKVETEPKEIVTATPEISYDDVMIPTPKTLDEELLDIYHAAEPGNMSLGQIMVQTGIDEPILIKQAWDRLYDLRKVPFSKLFKPGKGYIGIE